MDDVKIPAEPVTDEDPTEAGPNMQRWTAQRWLLDQVIASNGMEWDQGRLNGLQAAIGTESGADIAALRQRVRKYADIAPQFAATARRREARAIAAEEDGEPITARENYFMASLYWASAQWPIDTNNETNVFYNQRKRDCYLKYAELADHHVEAAWIPFEDGRSLPGWFHLPPGYSGGELPCVVSIPGMDGFKERGVALYGDRFLNRGIAVLSFEGPGQYENPVLGNYFSVPAWEKTGPALYDWLAARKEVDAKRIGIVGSSFASFFSTIAIACEPRFAACAVTAVCHEPGSHTIFQEASPTFKRRFMYMSDFTDEDAFDEFRKTMTWEAHTPRIKMPYLCVAGECDELSPLRNSERLVQSLAGPKRLVVYEGAKHGLSGAPSISQGPYPPGMIANWMAARLDGKPFDSEYWFVEASGNVRKTPY